MSYKMKVNDSSFSPWRSAPGDRWEHDNTLHRPREHLTPRPFFLLLRRRGRTTPRLCFVRRSARWLSRKGQQNA